ncbi:MAG TPA: hypothetical protein VH083_15450 [Myxococcales bacterium]|jgi:hypothetical protein|nr:hypothetical protein [Myxococcales bacterium]
MKSANQPVSVRLDPQLKRRATAYAKRHKVGLTTGLRMIISEHLDAEESAAELEAAHRWQREQAWETFKRWERGESAELSLDDLRAAHKDAMEKARRK